jgi:hypothetical protein
VSFGQVLTSSLPYSITSANLELNYNPFVVNLNKTTFISIAKTKGTAASESEYVMEKYGDELSKELLATISLKPTEDIQEFRIFNNTLQLFINEHDEHSSNSILKVKIYDLTGQFLEDKILKQNKISTWVNQMGKGAVSESFELTIESCQNKSNVIPVDYQYTIRNTPDGKHFIVYQYIYSLSTLQTSVAIFDQKLNEVWKGNIPIDNNFISQGLYLNNDLSVYILNSDRMGRIVVIKYDRISNNHILMDVNSGTNKRESFKLAFLNDSCLYVANLVFQGDKLNGLMHSKFNFNNRLVEKINVHHLSAGIDQTAQLLRKNHKVANTTENWMNYYLTDFYLNEYEKVIFVIEKRQIESAALNYKLGTTVDIKNYGEKLAKVRVESIVLCSMNKEDQLLWENYYLKAQVNDVIAGLQSSSYMLNITDEGMIQMVVAESDNTMGVYTKFRYIEWKEIDGFKKKDLLLTNDDQTTMIRNYSTWSNNQLILVGKKGLLGKKTILYSYKLN